MGGGEEGGLEGGGKGGYGGKGSILLVVEVMGWGEDCPFIFIVISLSRSCLQDSHTHICTKGEWGNAPYYGVICFLRMVRERKRNVAFFEMQQSPFSWQYLGTKNDPGCNRGGTPTMQSYNFVIKNYTSEHKAGNGRGWVSFI